MWVAPQCIIHQIKILLIKELKFQSDYFGKQLECIVANVVRIATKRSEIASAEIALCGHIDLAATTKTLPTIDEFL